MQPMHGWQDSVKMARQLERVNKRKKKERKTRVRVHIFLETMTVPPPILSSNKSRVLIAGATGFIRRFVA